MIRVDDAEALAAQLRQAGKRIVFTNGCFDLLHRGHVDCLASSRKLGDVLIVGVNSDASVRRLKGADRPVNSEEHRVHVLQRLRSVDYVVVFEDDTPVELVRRIRPDVLTKGGDYLGQHVPGAEYAGELHLIPFVDGCSTSLAIDRIRKVA
ncbi:MAG: D-glycero-beta-D-manno-heptose 1-phosphate adenylyltransferase [Planctomycetaceae bacterium]